MTPDAPLSANLHADYCGWAPRCCRGRVGVGADAKKAAAVLAELRRRRHSTPPLPVADSFDEHLDRLQRLLEDPVFNENLSVQERLREDCAFVIDECASTATRQPTADARILAELKERFRQKRKEAAVARVRQALEQTEIAAQGSCVAVELHAAAPDLGVHLIDAVDRLVVSAIDQRSPLRQSAELEAGDSLLAVDENVLAALGWTSQEVRGYVVDAAEKCTDEYLVVVLTLLAADRFDEQRMVLSSDWTELQVVHLPNDGSGLGFGIVGGRSTGVVVKTILPGAAADKDGRLRPGDHLLQIGSVPLHGMSSQQVAMILRQQDSAMVKLVVGRPANCKSAPNAIAQDQHTDAADRVSATESVTVPTKVAVDPTALEKHLSAMNEQPQAVAPPPAEQTGNDVTVAASTPAEGGAATDGSPVLSISSLVLDDVALSTFSRKNWQNQQYEIVEVELQRDAETGLGITVAGYVHKKEEIGGVFVKNLVPDSAAERSGRIQVQDLIYEVNGKCLEGLSHAASVRELVTCGVIARLTVVRFAGASPQALCLNMLREQETETQTIDVYEASHAVAEPDQADHLPAASPDSPSPPQDETDAQLKQRWRSVLDDQLDVLIFDVDVPSTSSGNSGLGLSLEGTVDVVEGAQLRSHHYIQRIQPAGPAGKAGVLRPGDELLEVNGERLHGISYVQVMRALSALRAGRSCRVVVARISQAPLPANMFVPRTDQTDSFSALPNAVAPLTSSDRLVKAKSEVSLALTRDEGRTEEGWALLSEVARRLRSRSLEQLHGLAVWSLRPTVIELSKGARGLGFSILDYQDARHPADSAIVVRSLVPGGVAHADGRLVPGDRLLFINDVDLTCCSLDAAVATLKAVAPGRVCIGVAKPLPFGDQTVSACSPLISRSERVLAKGSLSSPKPRRRLHVQTAGLFDPDAPPLPRQPPPDWSAELRRRYSPQAYYPSIHGAATSTFLHHSYTGTTLSGSSLSMFSWSPLSGSASPSPLGSPLPLRGSWAADVTQLPANLEQSVRIAKAAGTPVGVTLEAVDKALNGCLVTSVQRSGAVGKDGRVLAGDLLTKMNNESLRHVTESKARVVLKRANLIGTDLSLSFIAAADAQRFRERAAKAVSPQPSIVSINRLSPKVYPRFYRSPFMDSPADSVPLAADDTSIETDLSCSAASPPPIPADLVDWLAQTLVEAALDDAFAAALPLPDVVVIDRTSPSPPSPSSPSSPVDASPPIAADDDSIPQNWCSTVDTAENVVHVSSNTDALPCDDATRVPDMDACVLDVLDVSPAADAVEADTAETAQLPLAERLSTQTSSRDVSRQSSTASDVASLAQGMFQTQLSSRSKFWGEARTVELWREPTQSFGISIVGGRVEVSQKGGLPGTGNTVSGIFIKSVLPNSPAGRCSQLNMGDRIISVNNVDLKDATHEQAVEEVKNATNPVLFVVQSLHSFAPHQMVSGTSSGTSSASSVTSTPLNKAFPPPLSSSVDADDSPLRSANRQSSPAAAAASQPPIREETVSEVSDGGGAAITTEVVVEAIDQSPEQPDERLPSASSPPPVEETPADEDDVFGELPRRRPSDEQKRPLENGDLSDEGARGRVDSRSAAALRLDEDDEAEDDCGYTSKKIHTKYGELKGELFLARIERPNADGLGLTLAGNRDRDKMSVFVVGIDAHSPAALCQRPIRPGDELLEVNGLVLYGRSHLTASAVIRGIRDQLLKLVVLRRPNALDEVAARPVISPLSPRKESLPEAKPADAVVPSQQASGTPRAVRVRRGPSGFGITLTEGTTTDNLRGIFVTNISPEAPTAKERRLTVGDQVLAVDGQTVTDWSSGRVAQVINAATSAEIELTVATHTIVPLPTSPPMSAAATCSPAMTAPDAPAPRKNTQLSIGEQGHVVARKKSSASSGPNPSNVMVEAGHETLIEIDKSGKGLGLSIVGGSDTVLGTVVIHEVYPDGAACKDARLKPGDQVLEVNNHSLRNVSHDDAIAILRQTPAKVRLLVYRDLNLQLSLLDPTQIYNIFEIELLKKPGRGFGLSIVGRKSEPGVYVSEVVKGGTADLDGRLMQGDQILAVNAKDVTMSLQEEVATMLKMCTGKVLLKVGRWKLSDGGTRSPTSTVAPNSAPASAISATDSVHHARPVAFTLSEGSTAPTAVDSPPAAAAAAAAVPRVTVEAHDDSSVSARTPTSSNAVTVTEEDVPPAILPELKEAGSDTILVRLRKSTQQLGMGIGKRARGVLVTSLQPGSEAARELRVGDRLLAVNGVAVRDQQTAVAAVRDSGASLYLQLARPGHDFQNKSAHARTVRLRRGDDGFGFSIVGGVGSTQGDLPIFVKHVYSETAADGQLRRGDQILAVNGRSFAAMTHADAAQLLRDCGADAQLVVVPSDADEEPPAS